MGLTPLEAVTDSCSLPKTQRNQSLVLLVNKWSIQERYQFEIIGFWGTDTRLPVSSSS